MGLSKSLISARVLSVFRIDLFMRDNPLIVHDNVSDEFSGFG